MEKIGIGGYKELLISKAEEEIELSHNAEAYAVNEYSEIEEKYLIKLYDLCEEAGVKVVLLNTPIHPVSERIQANLKPIYINTAKSKMPNAVLVNHSSFYIPNDGFADLGHLNQVGATLYSEHLKTMGF